MVKKEGVNRKGKSAAKGEPVSRGGTPRRSGISSMAWVSRMLAPYYIVNALVCASFYYIRHEFIGSCAALEQVDLVGVNRETQIWFLCVLYLVLKFANAPTAEAFATQCFKFTKLAILVSSFLCNVQVGVGYLVLFALLLVLPQHAYKGPSEVVHMRDIRFYEEVLQQSVANNKQKSRGADDDVYWLVLFYTSWADTCMQFTPLFASLSLKYNSATLKFASVDLGIAAGLANELNIDVTVRSKQLPTLMLFRGGKQCPHYRLPPSEEDIKGSLPKLTKVGMATQLARYRMNEATVTKFFKLGDLSDGKKNV